MAAALFAFPDRPRGISQEAAEFVAKHFRRRLTIPIAANTLAEKLWERIYASSLGDEIETTLDEKRELLAVLESGFDAQAHPDVEQLRLAVKRAVIEADHRPDT